jgi:hypothetical protein
MLGMCERFAPSIERDKAKCHGSGVWKLQGKTKPQGKGEFFVLSL